MRRKFPTDKAYICLWVCFVTKAVHIELVKFIKISITIPVDKSSLDYPPRWKIKNAQWDLFSSLMDEHTHTSHTLLTPSSTNINIDVEKFTMLIQDTAKISIGMAPRKIYRPRVPRWNEEIKKSIQDKNRALKVFQSTISQEDFITLKKYKARTIFLVKNSKASSWKNFVSNIHNHSDPSSVWKKIKSLKGTNRHNNINLVIDSINSHQTPKMWPTLSNSSSTTTPIMTPIS